MKTSEVARRIVENVPMNIGGGILVDRFYKDVLSELDVLVSSERERIILELQFHSCSKEERFCWRCAAADAVGKMAPKA
jgi:hypothetical protein